MQTTLRAMLLILLLEKFYIFRARCRSLLPFLRGDNTQKDTLIVLHAAELVGMG